MTEQLLEPFTFSQSDGVITITTVKTNTDERGPTVRISKDDLPTLFSLILDAVDVTERDRSVVNCLISRYGWEAFSESFRCKDWDAVGGGRCKGVAVNNGYCEFCSEMNDLCRLHDQGLPKHEQ